MADTFRIYTNLPAGYDTDPDRQWPLFVYLDGDWSAGAVRDHVKGEIGRLAARARPESRGAPSAPVD
ncbi:MAG TPA: hypothetical protein VJN18_07960 [Polyangiaceae bacterium]|nr:hypothetical protein [Polyangiaceae bacterium]